MRRLTTKASEPADALVPSGLAFGMADTATWFAAEDSGRYNC